MGIRRPTRCALLKMCLVLCGCLAATRIFTQSDWTENHERIITSSLAKIEREKIKYPNEGYYVVSNLVQPSIIQTSTRGNYEIVICTQTSLNNLHNVLRLARHWDGYISVTVFAFGHETSLALYNMILLQKCSKNVRRKISFHLVYPMSIPPTNLTSIYKMNFDCHRLPMLRQDLARENYANRNISYPVNLLRSVALLNSKSEFVLNLDIDFIPSKGMKREMEAFLGNRSTSEKQEKIAYVIPCFESNTTFYDPLSKAEIVRAVKNGTVRQFTFRKCPECHSPTNYKKWLAMAYPSQMNASYSVKFKIPPYEPFYIADRKQIPLFDARFKQYGFNRVSQLCEAYYSGYDFVVMNNAFVIHDGFKDPKRHHKWKQVENYKNFQLFQTGFKRDLKIKYPDSKRKC